MKTSHFKQGDIVTLKPAKGASQRTQNRISEKGPSFVVSLEATLLSNTRSPIDGKVCACFRGLDNDWLGWLPIDEIHAITSLWESSMKRQYFQPGQIVQLDRPELGERDTWRFIVLSSTHPPRHPGRYSLYCIRAPSYRKADLNTIQYISGCSLRITED